MPAKRSINFRSGDLAEQLGLLILQNMALVAPIPRTEDVGIDAVVTLLENHDTYTYIATDSFFLQIKTNNSNEITYKPDEIKWLYDLELPFFIASVNQANHSINLYCCHRISEAYLGNFDRKDNMVINFEDYNHEDYIITGDTVSVGPPILSINLSDSQCEKKRNEFIKVCKSHIYAEKMNLQTRKIGFISYLMWREGSIVYTNTAIPYKWQKIKKSEGSVDIHEHMKPYIISLISHSLDEWDATGLENTVETLKYFISYIKNNGEIDYSIKDKGEDISTTSFMKNKDEGYKGGGFCVPVDGDSVTPFDPREFFSGKPYKK